MTEAVGRLLKRQSELPDNSRAVQIETVALTQRFPDLIQYLDISTFSVNQLVGALGKLAAAEAASLASMGALQKDRGRALIASTDDRMRELYSKDIADPNVASAVAAMRRAKSGSAWRTAASAAVTAINASDDPALQTFLGPLGQRLQGSQLQVTGSQLIQRGAIQASPAFQDLAARVSAAVAAGGRDNTGLRDELLRSIEHGTANATERQQLQGLLAELDAARNAAATGSGSSGSSSGYRRTERNRAAINRVAVRTGERELSRALTAVGRAADEQAFATAIEAAEGARDRLFETLREQAHDDANFMGKAEAAERLAVLRDDIAERGEKFTSDLAGKIGAALNDMLEAADNAAAEALRPTGRTRAHLQGQLDGLGLYSNRNAPDFVRSMMERQLARHEERALPVQIEAAREQIAGYDRVIDLAAAQQKRFVEGSPDWLQMGLLIASYNERLEDQIDTLHRLEGAASAAEAFPKSLAEGWKQARAEYVDAANLAESFDDFVLGNMTSTLETAHGELTGFFSDIFTGSKTALGAFADMARGIQNHLANLAAQFVAKQLFGALLGGVGAGGLFGGGRAAGGPVSPGKFYAVNERSTAPGLFIPLQPGRIEPPDPRGGMLDELARSASVAKLPMVGLGNGGPREMNVWVTLPEEKPTLGPNDVLVTVSQDMLQGGVTKKLVRHIALGG